jgi:hypothetical protein
VESPVLHRLDGAGDLNDAARAALSGSA